MSVTPELASAALPSPRPWTRHPCNGSKPSSRVGRKKANSRLPRSHHSHAHFQFMARVRQEGDVISITDLWLPISWVFLWNKIRSLCPARRNPLCTPLLLCPRHLPQREAALGPLLAHWTGWRGGGCWHPLHCPHSGPNGNEDVRLSWRSRVAPLVASAHSRTPAWHAKG